jgi:hypothetical protein
MVLFLDEPMQVRDISACAGLVGVALPTILWLTTDTLEEASPPGCSRLPLEKLVVIRFLTDLLLTVRRGFLRSGVVEATATSRKLGHRQSLEPLTPRLPAGNW